MPPLYDYRCDCGHEEKDVFNGVDEYPTCKCGKTLKRVIGNYTVIKDFQPYLDPHLGDKPIWVKSKQHRKQLMKEHGVAEKFGKGWY